MLSYRLSVATPLDFHVTGKFQAPNSNWIHETYPLTDYELILMTEGVLYLSYRSVNYTVTPGDYLLLPPAKSQLEQRQGFKNSQCSFYWMHFSCQHEVMESEYEEYPAKEEPFTLQLAVQSHLSMADKAAVLMKQLQDYVRSGYDRSSLCYMCTSILCEIHNQSRLDPFAKIPVAYAKRQTYYDIVDYIKQNLHNNLKVTDISDHFDYNEKYLSHLFSNIAGIPLKQFIQKCKMEAANFYLCDTNQSIAEIAMTFGYSDCHNFMKAYKKMIGITPTEYRNAFAKRLLYHI